MTNLFNIKNMNLNKKRIQMFAQFQKKLKRKSFVEYALERKRRESREMMGHQIYSFVLASVQGQWA